MTNIVSRARQALSGITTGQWVADESVSRQAGVWVDDASGVMIAGFTTPADAEFIAAAPALVAELADEVGRLQPRHITTAAELYALPVGTVVRDKSARIFECVRHTGYWQTTGEAYVWVGDELHLPCLLLWGGRDE